MDFILLSGILLSTSIESLRRAPGRLCECFAQYGAIYIYKTVTYDTVEARVADIKAIKKASEKRSGKCGQAIKV